MNVYGDESYFSVPPPQGFSLNKNHSANQWHATQRPQMEGGNGSLPACQEEKQETKKRKKKHWIESWHTQTCFLTRGVSPRGETSFSVPLVCGVIESERGVKVWRKGLPERRDKCAVCV